MENAEILGQLGMGMMDDIRADFPDDAVCDAVIVVAVAVPDSDNEGFTKTSYLVRSTSDIPHRTWGLLNYGSEVVKEESD